MNGLNYNCHVTFHEFSSKLTERPKTLFFPRSKIDENVKVHRSPRVLTWSGNGNVEKAGTLLAHLMLMNRRRAADSQTDSVATSYRYMGVPVTS